MSLVSKLLKLRCTHDMSSSDNFIPFEIEEVSPPYPPPGLLPTPPPHHLPPFIPSTVHGPFFPGVPRFPNQSVRHQWGPHPPYCGPPTRYWGSHEGQHYKRGRRGGYRGKRKRTSYDKSHHGSIHSGSDDWMASMLSDPWKELLTEEEATAHKQRIAQRFAITTETTSDDNISDVHAHEPKPTESLHSDVQVFVPSVTSKDSSCYQELAPGVSSCSKPCAHVSLQPTESPTHSDPPSQSDPTESGETDASLQTKD